MNQLQKYTWLIDTIRRAGKISHKDLCELNIMQLYIDVL